MRAIYRYEVPVDDHVHEVDLRGEILSVGCRDPRTVEFWAWHDDEAPLTTHHLTVVGTGHHVRWSGGRHLGTVQAAGGALVWHLLDWPVDADHPDPTPNHTTAGATSTT